MTDEEKLITEIVERYDSDADMLIPMMQDLQAECGYLPAEQLRRLSTQLDVPLTRIYGVATFYASFRLAPKGQHEVTLCMGTVCHLKGAPRISEAVCREFHVEPGGTTPDMLFTFQVVNCVGACAVAPVMVVDGEYHNEMTPASAVETLRKLESEEQSRKEESAV